eukprot:6544406-Karenia_brevis.AAC.1
MATKYFLDTCDQGKPHASAQGMATKHGSSGMATKHSSDTCDQENPHASAPGMATKRACDQAWPPARGEEELDVDVLGSASASSSEEQVLEVTSEEDEEGWRRPKRGEGVTG